MTITKRLLTALVTTAVMATSATAVMAQDGANIFVVGGSADDPFWSIVKRGADDAGKVVEAQGGSVTWLGPLNYDNLGPDAADLIRTALSQNPDAIVGPDWVLPAKISNSSSQGNSSSPEGKKRRGCCRVRGVGSPLRRPLRRHRGHETPGRRRRGAVLQ